MTLKKTSVFARIFRAQVLVGALGFTVLFLLGQTVYALSLIYGVGLMVVGAWWLALRLGNTRDLGVEAAQRFLYAGAALRFMALMAGLLLAHLIGLHLLLVAAGMFVAQAVVFISAAKEFKKEGKGEGLG